MTSQRTDDTAVIERYLDAVSELNLSALAETFAPHVVMDLPYAPAGFPKQVSGAEGVRGFFDGMPQMISPLRFHDRRIDAVEGTPGEYVAEYRSDARILATGRPYRNTYISRFTIRDGLITQFAEYFDPAVLIEALGGTVAMPGT